MAIARQRGDDAAGGRPRHRAARRRAGDQLRHERGRRPRTSCAHDFVATASDGSAHLPGRRRPAPPPRLRHLPPQDPLRPGREGPHARAGDPLVLGPAGRDPRPARPRRRSAPGRIADVVVFDPTTFRDAATFDDPTRYAPGVAYLFVNGVAAIAEGKSAGHARRAGRCGSTTDGPADLILKVGRIWTGDRDRPWAEAVAARGGVIVAVGTAGRGRAVPGAEDPRRRPPRRLRDAGPDRRPRPPRPSLGAEPRGGRPAGRRLARGGRAPGQGPDRRDARRRLDHGPELGPEPLARRRVPDRRRARRRRARPPGLAPPGRRPRRLGQLRGDAAGRGHRRDRRPPPTARSSATRTGSPTGVFIDGAMGLVGRVVPGRREADIDAADPRRPGARASRPG